MRIRDAVKLIEKDGDFTVEAEAIASTNTRPNRAA